MSSEVSVVLCVGAYSGVLVPVHVFCGAWAAGVAGVVGVGGFQGGFIVGAASGAAGGFVSGVGQAALAGKSGAEVWASGFEGAFWGGVFGGIVGGVSGGIQAARAGGDFWTGEMPVTALGRRRASAGTVLPAESTDFDVQDVALSTGINDCVPTSMTEGSQHFGVDIGYNEWIEAARVYGYKPGIGMEGKGLETIVPFLQRHLFTRQSLNTRNKSDRWILKNTAESRSSVRSARDNGELIYVWGNDFRDPETGRLVGHLDVVRSIQYTSKGKVIVNLRIGSFKARQLVGKRFFVVQGIH